MKRVEIVCLLLTVLSAGNTWADVYRCEENGKVTYSDRRCKNAEPVRIQAIDPDRAAAAAESLEKIEKELAEAREKEQEAARQRAEEAALEEQARQMEIQKQRQVEQIRRDMKFPGRVYHYDVP